MTLLWGVIFNVLYFITALGVTFNWPFVTQADLVAYRAALLIVIIAGITTPFVIQRLKGDRVARLIFWSATASLLTVWWGGLLVALFMLYRFYREISAPAIPAASISPYMYDKPKLQDDSDLLALSATGELGIEGTLDSNGDLHIF